MTSTGGTSTDAPKIAHIAPNLQWLRKHGEAPLEPQRPIVDAHHHLWSHYGGYYLDDLLADTSAGHNVVATVFVQCGSAYRESGPEHLKPVGETEFVVGVAKEAERLKTGTRACAGIVGTADLSLGAGVEAVLQAHIDVAGSRFKGIRHVTARHEAFSSGVLARPPARQMYEPAFRQGFARLVSMGLTFDAWLYHPQIPELTDLARAFPEASIVLDHIGGPLGVGPYRGRRDEVYREWLAAMKELAACGNVRVKLGGLAMAVGGFDFHLQAGPPTSERLAGDWRPYLLATIELFGAQRCMFESNFPVDKGMTGYGVLWNAFKRIASGATADEKNALFHGTATGFYHLAAG